MNKKHKKKLILPHFKNEDEERAFWEKIDFSEYIDAKDLVPVSFPNLRPTTRPISLRLPTHLLARVKEQAHEIDIPYQALIKKYIADGIAERKHH